ncbi:MFS transporter [Metabacillus rhizolycopersici]|uniref:MFS transporter n=1 Tax=Metabacillus rhizolycopersici TaxID=2875709 RepID=A0ABS7UMS2_9BACI|nr:MFS transporter [Metabacillus rhizolycopersici]MBZ5749601.1 MFS transporter [Metabacillus rhizolycopersici]
MSVQKNVSLVKNHYFLIAAIAFGIILNPLNTSMITVALPEIKNEFSLTSNDITWLIASYFIVCAMFLPLIGKLSDYYGRKKIFLFGLLLVSISSFAAPLSQNMPMLLGMRAIQAIGTSALYPAGMGIVRSYIEKNQNKVIGLLTVCATTSAAFGPTISGLLIQQGGWHVIFYINFPIIIISAVLAVFFIPQDKKGTTKTFKWDGIGIIIFSCLISLWIYFLQTLQSGLNVGALIGSLALTFLFYFFEKRKEEPFIDVVFLRKNPNISLVYIQYIFATIIFFAMLLSVPSYLQSELMLSPKLTGLIMLSLSVFSIISTPLTTHWIEKSGYKIPLFIGVIIGVVGVVLLMTINHSSPLYWIFIVLSIIGFSNGILNIGLQTLLYSFVSTAETGTASGLFLTSRFIGNILASSAFGIMFATGVNDTNLNWMTVILIVVSVILLSGILFITKRKVVKGTSEIEETANF